MRRRLAKVILFLTLFAYIPVQSMAWGQLGHRIVGEIADSYLTAKARAEIQKILGTESIAIASTWGDFIKSDTAYKYVEVWHYIDFEKNLTYEQLKEVLKSDTTVKDLYSAVNFIVKELKKKSLPKDKKLMYLRLLIHFVGDIHQPLHVSPAGTAGGNSIKVQWFNGASNLHRIWDSDLIEYQQLSYTEYTKNINHSTLAQRRQLQSDPISKWFYESYAISEKLENEITENNPRLGYVYNYDHIKLVNDQLLKGGIRLAGLLNAIFGS
jgi:hypothetical protein